MMAPAAIPATVPTGPATLPIAAPPPYVLQGVLDEIDRPLRGATGRRGRRGVLLLAAVIGGVYLAKREPGGPA